MLVSLEGPRNFRQRGVEQVNRSDRVTFSTGFS